MRGGGLKRFDKVYDGTAWVITDTNKPGYTLTTEGALELLNDQDKELKAIGKKEDK